uniref:DUF6699 domain-containing protein n=1 Tax=Psilocybe cubensis TaxID=181762 RepID=A0A8H7XMG6_PSICU
MNHSTNVGVSSAWTLSSSSSWGTASASGYSDCDSSSQSWGVDRGKTPFGSVSSVSLGPSGSTTSVPSPWGSQATLVNGGHALPPEASSSYSYTRYPGPSLSTASTTTLVNPPVGVQGLSHLGYPTHLPERSPHLYLHPSLQDSRLCIDFARPLPKFAPKNLQFSGFNPSITYMDVHFEGFPYWTLRIHTHHALTMWDIISHIHYHLQSVDIEATSANQRTTHNVLHARNHNLNPAVHGAGVRRIDALGRRTKFAGFKPTGGANGWIIYFSN